MTACSGQKVGIYCKLGAPGHVCATAPCGAVKAVHQHRADGCSDPACLVCQWYEQSRTGVQHPFPGVPRKREAFPSLSLMSKPITPALPRLRFFPDCDVRLGNGKWRCRVELADIARKHPTLMELTPEQYRANGPEGWGNTKERAYEAWKSKWRACMEQKYRE